VLKKEESLSKAIDKAVKHYSSLFVLPTFKKILMFLASLCIIGGTISTILLFPSIDGLVNGLTLGSSIFILNIIADYMLNKTFLRKDPIYNFRRLLGLSLFSWVFWFLLIFIGATIAVLFKDVTIWTRFCLLGFSTVMILRLIVFNSTTFISNWRILCSSLVQPFSCIIPFLFLWSLKHSLTPGLWLFLPYSIIISLASSFIFTYTINNVAKRAVGVSSLSLFKAFLLNWIANLNAPFEKFLDKLGKEKDVEISILKFASSASKTKGVIVIPSIHPGPFKNVGSSLLSSMLKNNLEEKLDCVACVPHGLLGHEADLTSQRENEKVIKEVIAASKFKVSETKASPFVKVKHGAATACCQIFGKSALLSLSLAPQTTEDLPKELGLYLQEEAKKIGLNHCAVINAHNSTDGEMNLADVLDDLKKAGVKSLITAYSSKKSPFKIGASSILPKEFTLRDGMGPGGITSFVIEVNGQKAAYIVIDGNNMVSGLRERIISAVKSIGVDECEVFTTDTHAVNAVVMDRRGYHPVGEVMDNEKLIGYVKKTVSSALSKLEKVKVSCVNIIVPKVKVIGAEKLEKLCLLTDEALKKAKKISLPLFGVTGLLLILFLAFA